MASDDAYEELGIAAALSRPCDYPTACYELSAVLRLGYSHLSKRLQFLVFQDTLLAFRILPDIHTGYEVVAANSLVQAAESALPKQKKVTAVSEFKRSIVTHKRRSKSYYDGDTAELPYDALVHVFSFLDMRSVAAASLVCWSWNYAANENTIWQRKYSMFFGDSFIKQIGTPNDLSWKGAFREKYEIELSAGGPTNRAVCRKCGSTVWLSTLTCRAPHCCAKLGTNEQGLRLISARRVVKDVLGDDLWEEFFPDTDSDLEESSCSPYQLRKLWAYPRLS